MTAVDLDHLLDLAKDVGGFAGWRLRAYLRLARWFVRRGANALTHRGLLTSPKGMLPETPVARMRRFPLLRPETVAKEQQVAEQRFTQLVASMSGRRSARYAKGRFKMDVAEVPDAQER